MKYWSTKVQIKHLLTDRTDHKSVQQDMSAVAGVLKNRHSFNGFKLLSKFENIPKGDDFFTPEDYANKLLSAMYDYADAHKIWIE